MKLPLLFFLSCLLIGMSEINAQGLKPYSPSDGPIAALLGLGGGLTVGTIYLNSKVDPFTEEEVKGLEPFRVPGIDRYSLGRYSKKTAKWTDKVLFGSLALPLVVMATTERGRNNFGNLGLVLFEGALINTGLINLSKTTVRRPRPFVYNPDAPMELRTKKSARYSFFSGHAATTAFFSITAAKFYNDLYPDSKARPYVWTAAALIPTAVSYGRMRAGKHFFTDVLVGFAVGTTVALLVPELNRTDE